MHVLATKISENFTREIFYWQKYPDLWYQILPSPSHFLCFFFEYLHLNIWKDVTLKYMYIMLAKTCK